MSNHMFKTSEVTILLKAYFYLNKLLIAHITHLFSVAAPRTATLES